MIPADIRGQRILIVDDNATHRRIVVALLDMAVPGMDGFEALGA